MDTKGKQLAPAWPKLVKKGFRYNITFELIPLEQIRQETHTHTHTHRRGSAFEATVTSQTKIVAV